MAQLFPDEIIVRSGGWQTVTTKDRLNQLLSDYGHGIYQKDYAWFVVSRGDDGRYDHDNAVPFGDGMTLKRTP